MKKKNSKEISLALLGSYPPIRGISPYCAELTDALSENLKKVLFLSFKRIYPVFLYPDGANQTDHTARIRSRNNVKVIKSISWNDPFSWINAACSINCDLLHAQWWSLPLFPVYFTILSITKLKKKPIVLTVHNALPHEPGILYYILTSILFKLSDHFIVHTNTNKEQLHRHFGIRNKDVTVIPHGPIGIYANSASEATDVIAFRKKLEINEKRRIILIFGAIRDYKGIDIAIKSLKKLHDDGLDYHLIIAGKAWISIDPYKKLASDMKIDDRVTFHTDFIPASDVNKYFDSADMVILPYKHFDAQSGVASVVGSFGKPMIVSDTGGLSDWVSDKKWAVPPGNYEELADAIKKSMSDQDILSEMASGSKRLAEKFSWRSIAKKNQELYKRILDQNI